MLFKVENLSLFLLKGDIDISSDVSRLDLFQVTYTQWYLLKSYYFTMFDQNSVLLGLVLSWSTAFQDEHMQKRCFSDFFVVDLWTSYAHLLCLAHWPPFNTQKSTHQSAVSEDFHSWMASKTTFRTTSPEKLGFKVSVFH